MRVFKNKKFVYLRVIVSIALLGLLIWIMRNKIPKVLNTLQETNMFLFMLALLLFLIDIVFASTRLKIVFAAQKIYYSLKDTVYLTFIGFFFNNFLPTSIGGDAVKAYYTSRRSKETTVSISGVLLDRIFGVFTFVGIALWALIMVEKTPVHLQMMKILSIFIFLSLIGITFLSSSKLVNKFGKLSEKLNWKGFKKGLETIHTFFMDCFKNWTFLTIIGLSLLTQLGGMLSVFVLCKSLGLEMSFMTILLTLPIIFAVSMFPSINGLGVREGAFVFCWKDIIGHGNAFAVALLFLGVLLIMGVIGAILFLLNKGYGDKEVRVKE